jgi:hypothetical protein
MINYSDIKPKLIIRKERETYNKPSIEDMFERIINITDKLNNKIKDLDININNKFEVMNNKFENLEKKIIIIESKIYLSNTPSNEDDNNLKELIREKIDIDKNDVLKALSYRDYRSVLNIFKSYYKNNNNKYPIRLFKVRKYEYYSNKKWNEDLYGNHIIEILFNNIQDLFIRNNDINVVSYDDFLLNQEFIEKLDNEKNKKSIFKIITDEIKE